MILTPAGFSAQPSEQLSDPVLETRAREISKGLRCVVCQNQSIDDSDAPLAADMRALVRTRLLAGDSNDEVVRYITDRYGNFVLLQPPFMASTYALWLGPLGFVLFGAVMFWRAARRKPAAKPSAEDQQLDEYLTQLRK
ncbi:MAG: cytochrome c-type biogenesis protein CcmH [Robiginitomaculum sp.]|nr:cytochrome c-type biogenesis protein CcmH [Robiginitomaculum sp.]